MNLLLLEAEDLIQSDLAAVAANRYPARAGWWPPQPGRRLRVGLRDGLVGEGCIESTDAGNVHVRFTLTHEPPPSLPLALLMALPRPKMLRRVLRTSAELGIKQLYLINAARVEKSYWQSPLLAPAALLVPLRDGLEQVCDTRMPVVHLRPRLRPFVEDELAAIAGDSERIIAHPAATLGLQGVRGGQYTLAIGPEGGFSEFELRLFERCGFRPRSLGPRILRCETALPVCVTALFASAASQR